MLSPAFIHHYHFHTPLPINKPLACLIPSWCLLLRRHKRISPSPSLSRWKRRHSCSFHRRVHEHCFLLASDKANLSPFQVLPLPSEVLISRLSPSLYPSLSHNPSPTLSGSSPVKLHPSPSPFSQSPVPFLLSCQEPQVGTGHTNHFHLCGKVLTAPRGEKNNHHPHPGTCGPLVNKSKVSVCYLRLLIFLALGYFHTSNLFRALGNS